MPKLLEPILRRDEPLDSEERLIWALEKISATLMVNFVLIVIGVTVVIALLVIAILEH